MVVKTLLYCTIKCGCEGGVVSASCHLQPPRKSSTGQVPPLEHETLSRTVLGTPRDDLCILGRVLDSAFMQARLRLSCSNRLIYTGHHTFRRHASPPQYRRLWQNNLSSVPHGRFCPKIIRPNSFFETSEGSPSSRVRNAQKDLILRRWRQNFKMWRQNSNIWL